jgi:uncharacterized repeat protein (TIGR01451 family)
MPSVSGRLQYDATRTATSATSNPGIQGVAIVLQDLSTQATGFGLMVATLTDGNGAFRFTSVPAGNYQVVESFTTPTTYTTAVDWSSATLHPIINGGTVPPISFVFPHAPPTATHLDCTVRNTWLETVETADITNINILNGPVAYVPLALTSDPITVDPNNRITDADSGSFGYFASGSFANTGAGITQPYPETQSAFNYVEPQSSSVCPNDGEFTIQNIMNNSHSNQVDTWWRIADHTAGNETGRMMVVNGTLVDGNPVMIGKTTVAVQPNTYYLSSWWVLNLCKIINDGTYANPSFRAIILDENGGEIYSHDLGEEIPINPNCPEWKQIGTIFDSGENNQVTIQFISTGPAATGNDYVIDDIALNEVSIPIQYPNKSVDKAIANIGDTITFKITLNNPTNNPFNRIFFRDTLQSTLQFVPGSVIINGTNVPSADPVAGFSAPAITAGNTLTIAFQVIATAIPDPNPVPNDAQISYFYSPVLGGAQNQFTGTTNIVTVLITDLTLNITKDVCPYATSGGTLYYPITIKNPTDFLATQVVLTDTLSDQFEAGTVKYSLDGGDTWLDWTGTLQLNNIDPIDSTTLIIRGTVAEGASGSIINRASVDVVFCQIAEDKLN